MTTPVKQAMSALKIAIAHRAKIGAEITVDSPPSLIKMYEDALEAESVARHALGDAIAAELKAQKAAACIESCGSQARAAMAKGGEA